MHRVPERAWSRQRTQSMQRVGAMQRVDAKRGENDQAAAGRSVSELCAGAAGSAPDSQRQTAELAERLVNHLRRYRSVVVAFSGGVDSAVVAAAAQRALGARAIAVTARSPSVSAHQLGWAERCAREIGIRHRVECTAEAERADYRRNDSRRCFFCKQTLYTKLREVAQRESAEAILSGTNADDLGDYRPGIEAGNEAGVVTPLADLRMGKEAVRAVAKHWGLSNWDLPAAPCLASRLAYGVEATPERLRRVERAEAWLREQGICDLRVRVHPGELARIEMQPAEFARFAKPEWIARVVAVMTEIGFAFVTLDLCGLQSGSLNALIQIESKTP